MYPLCSQQCYGPLLGILDVPSSDIQRKLFKQHIRTELWAKLCFLYRIVSLRSYQTCFIPFFWIQIISYIGFPLYTKLTLLIFVLISSSVRVINDLELPISNIVGTFVRFE